MAVLEASTSNTLIYHEEHDNVSFSTILLFFFHIASALPLIAGIWIFPHLLGYNLVQRPLETLRLALCMELPVLLLLYAFVCVRLHSGTAMEAIGRGIMSLPIGAIAAAFGAILFGAPLELKYGLKTLHWALLMSLLSVLPTATIFGQSWSQWQRLFAFTRPAGAIEYLICVPAHVAAIGAWMGAWPMPLDWDRPWQEWPICATYGMVTGYLVGLVLSLVITLFGAKKIRQKQE